MGERFGFGKNWSDFLETVEPAHVARAEQSLREMLGVESLAGLRFLDAGCGSGLFSLAARRLGAEVRSFDYDPDSVACTRAIRERFAPEDHGWTIEQGSVLDADYLKTLGTFDVVYSWGVLHHTGDMLGALEAIGATVRDRGLLFIAIYNYQPIFTAVWTRIKRAYNTGPEPLSRALLWLVAGWYEVVKSLLALARFRNPWPPSRWREYRRNRGMSLWHDYVDWVGGYPFEAARPEAVFRFFRDRGYVLRELKTCAGRHGCNEFVFRKEDA
jgi:2-polyprenyl-6-hydroxyphenyl methylase/3-demethylubiquinone-9 3-methyltransferase